MFLKLLQKVAEEATLPNSFYEATITLITNPKTTQKRKPQANITDEYRCKIPQQRDFTDNSVVKNLPCNAEDAG